MWWRWRCGTPEPGHCSHTGRQGDRQPPYRPTALLRSNPKRTPAPALQPTGARTPGHFAATPKVELLCSNMAVQHMCT